MSAASDMLASYLAAEKAVLEGKTINFQGRSMSMEDLDSIRAGRREWEEKVSREMRPAGCKAIGGMSFSVARFKG